MTLSGHLFAIIPFVEVVCLPRRLVNYSRNTTAVHARPLCDIVARVRQTQCCTPHRTHTSKQKIMRPPSSLANSLQQLRQISYTWCSTRISKIVTHCALAHNFEVLHRENTNEHQADSTAQHRDSADRQYLRTLVILTFLAVLAR